MFRLCLPVLSLLIVTPLVSGQDALPLVDRGDVRHLRENCRWLLKALEDLRAPLPQESRQELEQLLANGGEGPETIIAIQKVLDPFCLVGVTINPESRVKGARGPAAGELTTAGPRVFLVKVHNDAGVTQALQLTSPHIAPSLLTIDRERWLHARFQDGSTASQPRKLSGHEVEYLILGCQALEAGKCEAKLIFDVGQGTQDLGFRAEVPILFTVRR